MAELPDGSVHLVVTSPPYYNLREYCQWPTYEDHLAWLRGVLAECYRVLAPGGWICWNIQECIPRPRKKGTDRLGCWPYLAHTINAMESVGFCYEKDIIWYKGKGTATQKLFGSFPFPNTFLVSGLTEHIITARKARTGKRRVVSKETKEASRVSIKEWGEWATDLWHIPPVTAKSKKHPAPYPVEIPNRCIRLWSFAGDIVLDPFMGSGSTAVAAKRLGRRYVGYEIHAEYIQIAHERVQTEVDIFAEVEGSLAEDKNARL